MTEGTPEGNRLYPLRQTLVEKEALLSAKEIEPLSLAGEERKSLASFEGGLFDELRQAKALPAGIHTIYTDYLTTEKGWQSFCQVYLGGKTDQPRPVDWQQAEKIFSQVDLKLAPLAERRKFADASEKRARDGFLEAVFANQGEVADVPEPQRASRIVDPEGLRKRIKHLRELKLSLKPRNLEPQLREDSENSAMAKRLVAGLYRREINALLAEFYDEKVVLEAPPKAARVLARVDRFLWGTGLKIGNDGLFEPIPKEFTEWLEAEGNSGPRQGSEAYRQYASCLVNSQQAGRIATAVFALYPPEVGAQWGTKERVSYENGH